ncbi:uncharacterized protein LOC120346998 isoform X2 [Styela clava]
MTRLAEDPHPNVVTLLDHFRAKDLLFLVQEYAGTSLLRCIQEYFFSEEMARNFFVQIVNGVKYLHGKGVAHRDLKLENIILGEDGTIKLCDFGLACEFTPGGNDVTTGKCGTVHYAAPELKSSHSYAYRAQPADVWSLGAVLYVLCHRRKLKNKRSSECIQRKLELSSRLSDDCCDIIRRMLRCHPLERITVTEILNHPWMTVNPDQLQTDSGVVSEEDSSANIRRKSDIKSSKRFWALPCAIHGDSASNKTDIAGVKSRYNVRAISSIHSIRKLISELPRIDYKNMPQTAVGCARDQSQKIQHDEKIPEKIQTPRIDHPKPPPVEKKDFKFIRTRLAKAVTKATQDVEARKESSAVLKRIITSQMHSSKQGSIIKNTSLATKLTKEHGAFGPVLDVKLENHGITEKQTSAVAQYNKIPSNASGLLPTPPRTTQRKVVHARHMRPGLKNFLQNGLANDQRPLKYAWKDMQCNDKAMNPKEKFTEAGNSQNWTREILKNNIILSKTELENLKRCALNMKKNTTKVSFASNKRIMTPQFGDNKEDDTPAVSEKGRYHKKISNGEPKLLLKRRLSKITKEQGKNSRNEAKSRKLRMAPTLSTSSESVSVYSSRFKRPITSVHQRFGSGSSIASSSGSNILIKAAPEVGKNIYADYSTDPGNSRTIAQKPRRI